MLLSNMGRPGGSSISERATLTTQIVKRLDAVHTVTAEARPERTRGGRARSLPLRLGEEHL